MASYVFMRSINPASKWTLEKVISYGKGKRYQLADFRTEVGKNPAIDIWIIEAGSETEARRKLRGLS